MQKKNIETDLTLFTKINSKWIIDPNVNCETIKLLEDYTEENLDIHGLGNDFLLDMTPKA